MLWSFADALRRRHPVSAEAVPHRFRERGTQCHKSVSTPESHLSLPQFGTPPYRRPSSSLGVSVPERPRPPLRCHPPLTGAHEREAFGAVGTFRCPFSPQTPQDNRFAACPRHNVMPPSPCSLADHGSPRIPECPPPVDLPGSPPLPPPRRAGGSRPFGSGLIQPASRQFRPLFYGGAGRAKFPPHPSSGGRERPRGAQHHGRRAGERLPPDDIIPSYHHITTVHNTIRHHTYIWDHLYFT